MINKNKIATENAGGVNTKKKKNKFHIVQFIICVLIAFSIWVYVMNVKMSDNTKTFSIVPDVKGESTLQNEAGLSVFGSVSDPVKITIKGTKAEMLKYSEKDFKVSIDVSTAEEAGISSFGVAVESPSAALTVVQTEPSMISLMIDYMETREIPLVIRCVTDGSKFNFKPSIDKITVSGPRTQLDKISVARCEINVDEEDIGTEILLTNIVLLDGNETPLIASYLEYDVDGITVHVSAADTEEK